MQTYSLHKIYGHCAHSIELYMIMRPLQVNKEQLELDKLSSYFILHWRGNVRVSWHRQMCQSIFMGYLISHTGVNVLQSAIPMNLFQ